MIIKANDTILFQGDSITDAGRGRGSAEAPLTANAALGSGYAAKAATMLLTQHSGLNLNIHNRGISGNRITNMRDRWQEDCLDLKPNILSIMIGVNDTWHGVANGTPENGVGLDAFERIFRELIATTRDTLPNLKLVICEPFTAETGAVVKLNFHPDIDDRRERVRAIAKEHADVFVPFQDLFDKLCKQASPAHWTADGVHPTDVGHAKMAEFWMQSVCG